MNKLYPWQNELWERWVGLRTRLPHALLLKGAQGVGKLDFALNLSQSLLCEEPLNNGFACEGCPSCHWFKRESHPDFRLLQPDAMSEAEEADDRDAGKKKLSRQISVDQVRELADFVNLSAHRGGHRVVLIYPAETMNANAANALLKTLEEPSGNMLIILVSHKPQQLLPTILSRCLTFAVPLPQLAESEAWLERQGINNPKVMLARSGFAPLLAVRLAGELSEAEVCDRFLREISQPDKLDAYALADQLQRTEPSKVIQWLQQWCYDVGSAKLTGKIRYNPELIDCIENLSGKVASFDLLRYQKELMVAKREALHPLNSKLLFESVLLTYRQVMLAAP